MKFKPQNSEQNFFLNWVGFGRRTMSKTRKEKNINFYHEAKL